MRNEVDCIVVGAGISGLVAAYRLSQRNFSVRVIEAAGRVGGRLKGTRIADGSHVEAGGQWVGDCQPLAMSLIGELGLQTYATYTAGNYVKWANGCRKVTATDSDMGVVDSIHAWWLLRKLDRLSEGLDLKTPWALQDARTLDRQTFATWIDQNAKTLATRSMLADICGGAHAGPPESVSLLHVLLHLKATGGISSLLSVGGALRYRIAGGSHRLAEVIADRLRDFVYLNQPVRQIEQDAHGATVTGDGFSARAKSVIVAAHPSAVANINFFPALNQNRNEYNRRFVSGTGRKIHAVYPKPFWRDEGLNGWASATGLCVGATFDNTPMESELGVLMAFCETGSGNSDDRNTILQHLALLFGANALSPLEFHDTDWAYEPFSHGCVTQLPPGVISSYGAGNREPSGRLHWCGAERALRWDNHIEGAIETAEAAADSVANSLGAGNTKAVVHA